MEAKKKLVADTVRKNHVANETNLIAEKIQDERARKAKQIERRLKLFRKMMLEKEKAKARAAKDSNVKFEWKRVVSDEDIENNPEVRALAERLAPQVELLEGLLLKATAKQLSFAIRKKKKDIFNDDEDGVNFNLDASESETETMSEDDANLFRFDRTGSMDSMDDSMQAELKSLVQSEEQLFKELELAREFSTFFQQMQLDASTSSLGGLDDNENPKEKNEQDQEEDREEQQEDEQEKEPKHSQEQEEDQEKEKEKEVEEEPQREDEQEQENENETVTENEKQREIDHEEEANQEPERNQKQEQEQEKDLEQVQVQIQQEEVHGAGAPRNISMTPAIKRIKRTLGKPDGVSDEHMNMRPLSETMFMLRSPKTANSNIQLKPYTYEYHDNALGLQREPPGAWYSIDLTRHILGKHMQQPQEGQSSSGTSSHCLVKEYCLAMPESQRWYHGIMQIRRSSKSISLDSPIKAPVRTIAIRIRPDVRCEAVMDVVRNYLVNNVKANILARRDGHLRTAVSGLDQQNDFDSAALPPCAFNLDADLCTYTSSKHERFLLIRVYHPSRRKLKSVEEVVNDKNEIADGGNEDVVAEKDDNNGAKTEADSNAAEANGDNNLPENQHNNDQPLRFSDFLTSVTELENKLEERSQPTDHRHCANTHLREACALIQYMESHRSKRKSKELVMPKDFKGFDQMNGNNDDDGGNDYMKHAQPHVSAHLLKKFRACPSVSETQKKSAITLPSLSKDDWPIICSAWPYIEGICVELHMCQLTYLSLGKVRFGASPSSLRTLDEHYCSQLTSYARKVMSGRLLAHANRLEECAEHEEAELYDGWELLIWSVNLYKVTLPDRPVPLSLSGFPLDFNAQEERDSKVLDAMNFVAAMSGEEEKEQEISVEDIAASNTSSFEMAEKAVQVVWDAVKKETDEEEGARLHDKNEKFLDRVEKVKGHQRDCINLLSSLTNPNAVNAADEFYAAAEKDNFLAQREAPLVYCGILVGKTKGYCYITSTQLLLVKTSFFSSGKSTLFVLKDIDLDVIEETANYVLRAIISVKRNGKEVYSFRPSWVESTKFKSFVDALKKLGSETTLESIDEE